MAQKQIYLNLGVGLTDSIVKSVKSLLPTKLHNDKQILLFLYCLTCFTALLFGLMSLSYQAANV